jgi:hypothetical protein
VHDTKVVERLPDTVLFVTVAEPVPAIEHAANPGTLPLDTV